MAWGCAGAQDANDYSVAGATYAAHTAAGYELWNREVRFTLDGQSGDVIGFCNGREGAPVMTIRATLAGLGDARPIGHIEARDAQTWEFVGVDSQAQIGWRKIYTLDGANLDVSYLIENQRNSPVWTRIGLIGDYPTIREGAAPPQEVEMDAGEVRYHFMAFDESQETQPAARAGETFLHSDIEPLASGERMSWTMRWWIEQ
jgi:hypothetical protein